MQQPFGTKSAPETQDIAHPLPLRQIHLDFHTPPQIENIGERFVAEDFVRVLKGAGVDQINLFAKCHHGYSYHDTAVGERHPGLSFDLLRAQHDACKAAGIKVQIYVSAGWDELAAARNPEWRKLGRDGEVITFNGKVMEGGWLELCFNTLYLDYLCAQIEEVATLFPDCDGLWLDIIHQDNCYCPRCVSAMSEAGLDPSDAASAALQMRETRQLYLERSTAAARKINPAMPVFHNMGHAPRGDRSIYPFYSHLELESLPTGGWGYDHFPLSAAFAQKVGKRYLGMTGRFNTLWGEFGGVKHENALLYECAAITAYGGAVCIGDHLHPAGQLDRDAYAAIGAAYTDLGRKGPWINDGANRVDLAVFSRSAQRFPGLSQGEARHDPVDSAVSRVLLESGFQFHLLDAIEDIFDYPLVIFPDDIVFAPAIAEAVSRFIASGGKVLLTGRSGRDERGNYALDIGAELEGESPFSPDFIAGTDALDATLSQGPMVVYGGSARLRPSSGTVLAWVHDPYLQKHGTVHYGHLHAPPRLDPSGFASAIEKGNIVTLAHQVFRSYGETGAVSQRKYIAAIVQHMLGEQVIKTNLPSNGRATVIRQTDKARDIVHLLYAPMMSRGRFKGKPIEVIEDIPTLQSVEVALSVDARVETVRLAPEGPSIDFAIDGGMVRFTVPHVECHRMVEVRYEVA